MFFNILKLSDFSQFPAGRTVADGPFSADNFRENILVPWINKEIQTIRATKWGPINVHFPRGVASSWLEQVFAGLVIINKMDGQLLLDNLSFIGDNGLFEHEIRWHIERAMLDKVLVTI